MTDVERVQEIRDFGVCKHRDDNKGLCDPCTQTILDALDARERRIEEVEKAVQLCADHQPHGGARSGCVICAGMRLIAALSRIDYICGSPNEYKVSGYDVHCNEDAVVERVQRLCALLGRLVEASIIFRDSIVQAGFIRQSSGLFELDQSLADVQRALGERG